MNRSLKNNSPRWATAVLIALGSLSMIACGDDDAEATLNMTLQNLEPLANGYVYEGWFLGGPDGTVSAGRFNLEPGQADASVVIAERALKGATSYVLTIEPPDDEDVPAPSKTHILGGSWNGENSELTIDAPKALENDFSSASGQFILGVPTASVDVEYSQGIWFLDPEKEVSSLELPELPDGWVYEGWVAGEEGPVSTGRFVDPSGVDDDAGGPAAGEKEAPAFPGQDFVEPATDLLASPMRAVISVEPEPDDSPAPFAFKPLIGEITDAGEGVLQELEFTEKLPSGTVSLAE